MVDGSLHNIPRYELADEDQGKSRLNEFDQNGFVVLSNCFSDERIEAALTELETHRSAEESGNRLSNAWRHCDAVRDLACDQSIFNVLEELYGRRPVPFQTLNFRSGSEQRVHCDSMHFSSLPPRFMCAVWVALEDVDANNGPLVYYPGSHRLPEYQLDDAIVSTKLSTPCLDDYEPYPDFLEQRLTSRRFESTELHLKKGDALIWSSNLAHGGMPILDPKRTRLSQITHYYFENCVYYTPRLSQPYIGRFWLRRIEDVRTAATVAHKFRDQVFSVPVPGLYVFTPNARPRPVGNQIRYRIAQMKNIARALLKKPG